MLNRLRQLFENATQKSQKKAFVRKMVIIEGTGYVRIESDIWVFSVDERHRPHVCPADHVASNGVHIQQIAYSLALIEGLIALSDTFTSSPFTGLK